MKQILTRLSAIALAFCLIATAAVHVSAEVPYESYTYWLDVSDKNKAVYNRPMYEAGFVIDSSSAGIGEFTKIQDITTDKDGNLFILDSDSRIVILNSRYALIREIGRIGGSESYADASGLYVHNDGTIYISDTEGHRVIQTNANGDLLEIITLPDSPLIPEDFDFRPLNTVIDTDGYFYVLSDGSYYGALLYSPDRQFLGFYGANQVTASVTDVLNNIKNRIFPNNIKKGNTAQRLPYCFVDFDIDNEGFIYTCNGYVGKKDRSGQIRKLSPGTGRNILGSDGINFVDTDINTSYKNGAMSKQDILDIEVDSQGFIYGLESAFGKVFLYDASCRILTVFGGGMGYGSQLGTFKTVSALTLNQDGSEVLVADSAENSITVFKITDFGKQVKQLIALTLAGDYEEAKDGWEAVLKMDNNFQPAYSGLARAYLGEGDYRAAMDLARKGYDRTTYAAAFEHQRKDFIDNHFAVLFALMILAAAGGIAFLVISTRKKLVLVRNRECRLMFNTLIHPSNSFTDIKEKHLGSVGLSVASVVIFYIVTILQTLAGGFLFSLYDASSFNSLWVFVQSVGFVALWIAANWMVCTLLEGKGKLKEILIVTCYSLWPLIIEKGIRLVLTNVLLPAEASFLKILDAIALLYFLFLMIIGLLRIHDFSMTKLIGTSVLSLLGVAAIVFLMIMIVILIQQFGGFIVTLISEILTL